MCGIAGFVAAGHHPESWQRALTAMGLSIAHRGPDHHGVWFDAAAGVGFVSRRLAILDLSPRGHQPMASADRRFHITYNGEIYNFLELRAELAGRGHRFESHSDTEVMLAAFGEWGLEGALQRFNGMFAFALWDAEHRRLHLVRDRLGEKPLYYGRVGGSFAFGSELKALAAHPGFDNPIDRRALADYLALGYVPTPRSIYQGIAKLPPGALLTLDPADPASHPAPRLYWDAARIAAEGARAPFAGGAEEARERLEAELRRAVRLRLVADVPVGAFLSGGIDSSLVVALMQAESARPVRTFTIGFAESGFDEAPQARRVAEHLGTEHTELYVSPREAMAVIPRLPDLFDEPFADSSQIPTFLVSEMARRHVKVSLSGDGGDELFGGYKRYRLGRDLWRQVGWLPARSRRGLARLLRTLPPAAADRGLGWLSRRFERYGRPGRPSDKLAKLAEVLAADTPEALYRQLVTHWRPASDLVVGAEGWPGVLAGGGPSGLPGFEHRMMALDLVTYLPDDILVKLDRAAMGVSLETRVPLLDPAVVELAWRLPLPLKRRGGEGKWILRRVLDRYVPRPLVERPKQGFAVPIGEWLRGPLRDWAEALLAPDRLRREGFLEPEAVQQKWRAHLGEGRDFRNELWDVLVFQQWLESRSGTSQAMPGEGAASA